jgi:hypothetical protein
MAVPVTASGSTIDPGTPVALFSTSPGSTFVAAPDGQRFLVNNDRRGGLPDYRAAQLEAAVGADGFRLQSPKPAYAVI